LTPETGPLVKVEKRYHEPSHWRVNAMAKKCMRSIAQFKFQLALQAAKGLKTINELVNEHSVHPHQVSDWKRRLLEAGNTLFSRGGAGHQRESVEPLDVLSCTHARSTGQLAADAADRRPLYQDPCLWLTTDDRPCTPTRVPSQPYTGAALDATAGAAGDLSHATHELGRAGPTRSSPICWVRCSSPVPTSPRAFSYA